MTQSRDVDMGRLLGVQEGEKVDIIIDGFSLYSVSRNLGFEVDYKVLYDTYADHCYLRRAHYLAAHPDTDYSPLVPLCDFLQYNGWQVVRKPIQEYENEEGKKKVRDSIIGELTVRMLKSAHSGIDHIVLYSSRSDFTAAVNECKEIGCRVTVVASRDVEPKISDDLRRSADAFMEISKLKDYFAKPPRETETVASNDRRPTLSIRK